MTRQSGYYWVTYGGGSAVAEYVDDGGEGVWFMTGVSVLFADSDFDQINETRILAPGGVSDERMD